MAYTKGPLVLSDATMDDIPALSRLYPRAYYSAPYFKKMMPDTAGIDKWWQESHQIAMRDPKTRVVKVTDQGNGDIVAMARWVLPGDDGGRHPGSGEGRWPEFTDDVDLELSTPMFGQLARRREELMVQRRHYCRCSA